MSKILMFVKLCLVLLVGGLSCTSTSREREIAEMRLQIGAGYLQAGNYPAAFSELLEAERLDPKNPIVQNNLALAHLGQERLSEAETHLLRALELAPKLTEARNNLGRVYIELGRFDEALNVLKLGTSDLTYPTPEKIHYNIGLAQYRKGHWDQAQGSLTTSLKLSRDYCPAHSLMGQVYYQKKKYERAAEVLDAAMLICKENFDDAEYYSGLSHYQMGFREKAIARFEELVKLYPLSQYVEKAKSLLKVIR